MTRTRTLALCVCLFALTGCGPLSPSSPTALSPKQQAAIANDAFAVAENVLTDAVRSGVLSPSENTRLIRPAVLAARHALDDLSGAVSRTPPDPLWKEYLAAVNDVLPAVLQYAKTTQARASTQPTH